MSKVGRNDPCPCGSGKKYKKCCIDKETEFFQKEVRSQSFQSIEDKWDDEETNDSLFGLNDFQADNEETNVEDYPGANEENEELEDDFLDKDDETDDEDEENLSKKNLIKNDPRCRYQIKDKFSPEISEEEDRLIDDWYDKYKPMKDPEIIQQHIENFMDQYPNLVENMELHHEVVFELGSEYLKNNRYDDFIEFLFRFRNDFPESYLKSFGYYDYDIIVWLVSKGRTDEVPPYLENFKKYPVDFVDKLFELLDFLYATNNSSLAYPLVSEIYPYVFYSREVFGGASIVTPIIIDYYSKILHPDYTDDEINRLVDNMKEIKVDLWDQYYNSEFWKLMFGNILKPFSKWEWSVPRKKAAFHRLHNEMINNYHRFFKEKTGVSWITANFFIEKLAEYFHKWIENSQKPHKVLFDFSETTMDKTIGGLISKMMWIDFTQYAGHFNAIYYFADYMYVCGNIDEIERDKIQTDCTRLYNKPLESLNRQYIEAKAFKQFPLWGRIQD